MSLSVRTAVPLAPFTTLKTGGRAAYFSTVHTVTELSEALAFADGQALPHYIFGGGSNILVPDSGLTGLVIQMQLKGRQYQVHETGGILATFGAGESFSAVVADSVTRGYWGLENLAAIPGTVGATPVQNVGAYGVEVSQLIQSVTIWNCATHQIEMVRAVDCQFGYRDSIFKKPAGQAYIVTAVTFLLATIPNPKLSYSDLATKFSTPPTSPQLVHDAVIAIRQTKFPDWTTVGTAGSFFKNPVVLRCDLATLLEQYPSMPFYPVVGDFVKVSLGYILDKVCGLRGYTIGHVGLYQNQALVLVTSAGATSADVDVFADHVTQIVYQKTKIVIEREVTKIIS